MNDDQTFLDNLAESFEAAWQRHEPVALAEFLNRVPDDRRLELAKQLLPIELEYRKKIGHDVFPETDYRDLGSEVVALAVDFMNEYLTAKQPWVSTESPTITNAEQQAQQDTVAISLDSPLFAEIGPYRLTNRIGQGGMGDVWRAEQTEPVKRVVAIKWIKPESFSADLRARFDLERQTLALMNHPNIARMIDAGTTKQGQPWFAMEFVPGIPLNQYCDDHQLNVTDRLSLFAEVLAGIQHAHQKGILHRDLKPSNILVTKQNGRAIPKIIDFGLAKPIEQLPEFNINSMNTASGMIVGTLQYMSPEQANLNQQDVDTRSDLYSMGVVLYELLVGKTPFAASTTKQSSPLELLQMIREQEANRPSRLLSGLSQSEQATISKSRSSESHRLQRLLFGELDWIALKSLEKDRDRRYQTAAEFANDIQNFLRDEPVAARPPSKRYRFGKFVRKNRVSVMASTLGLLALTTALVVSLISANRAYQAQSLSEQRLDETLAANVRERKARSVADAATQEANQRLEQVKRGGQLLANVFADLEIGTVRAGNEPLEAVLAGRLREAAIQLDGNLLGDPLIVAGLQNQLGAALNSLGFAADALPLCRKSLETRLSILGPDNPDTLTSNHNLGEVLAQTGDIKLAHKHLLETMQRRASTLGEQDPATLATMNCLGLVKQQLGKLPEALEVFQQVLQVREIHPGNRIELAKSMSNVAFCLRALGRYAEAIGYFESAHQIHLSELGERHPRTLVTMNNLAFGQMDLNQTDLALPMLERSAQLRAEVLGRDHPSTLDAQSSLAGIYRDLGQVERATAIAEDVLTRSRLKLGDKHPDTLFNMNNLARCYRAGGQLDKAIPLYEETERLRREELGHRHPSTLSSINNLALAYVEARLYEKALPLLEEAWAARKETLGTDHPGTLVSLNSLAGVYRSSGHPDKALPLFEQALELRRQKLGKENPQTINTMVNLAATYCELDRHEEAISLYQEAILLADGVTPFNPWERLDAKLQLAEAYGQTKQPEDAVGVLEQAFTEYREAYKETPSLPQRKIGLKILEGLIQFNQELGKTDSVNRWTEEKKNWEGGEASAKDK